MRVALKRNLFLGGNRYRADPQGVELPDAIDGKKLVTLEEFQKNKSEDRDEKFIPLPKDAEIYTEPVTGIKGFVPKGKTIPPQFPVNPTQSPPPGSTPTEGSASMAIDMADAELLVDDMNDPKTKSLTTDEALEKVERDKAKAIAEGERAKHEGTIVKPSDVNTLSGLTRAAEKEQVKDPKTFSEMHKGSAPTIKK